MHASSIFSEPGPITPATPLKRFVEIHYEARLDVSDGSQYQARIAVGRFNEWAQKAWKRSVNVGDINENSVNQFLKWYSRKVKPGTVNSKRRYLLHLWRAAWEGGLLSEPPRPGRIPKAKETAKIPESFTFEEMKRICSVAENLRGQTEGVPNRYYWASLIRVCYETGGRIGAIMQVRYLDFSLVEGWLILRGENDKEGKEHYFDLTEGTLGVIERTRPENRKLVWPWAKSNRWLCEFCKRFILKPAGVRCGKGQGGVFHKFRRTSGTLVEANGGDGSKHIGNTRAVFESNYLDRRIARNTQSEFLPSLDGSGARRRAGSGDAARKPGEPSRTSKGKPRQPTRGSDGLSTAEREAAIQAYLILHSRDREEVSSRKIAKTLGCSFMTVERSKAYREFRSNRPALRILSTDEIETLERFVLKK